MVSAMEQALGPRWSPKELRAFYILLKAVGKQWERLEERLPQRSQAMIRALYEMHSGYLSLPEASAEGFCAIMMDRYKTMDEAARQTIQDDQRRSVGPDESPLPSVSSLERKHASEMELGENETSPPSVPGVSDATRHKKKRKLDRLLAGSRNDGRRLVRRLEVDDGDHTPSFRSRKKMTTALTVRRRGSDSLRKRDVIIGRGGASCPLDLPWFYWFYSYIDADFFRHNEFIECLERMGLGKITRAARPVWASVRASMGRPRRLSKCFLAQEKQKLYSYRSIKARGEPAPPLSPMWPYQKTAELKVGLKVIVRLEHPRHFAIATIENFSLRDGVCKVRLETNSSRVCSLENVMVPVRPPERATVEVTSDAVPATLPAKTTAPLTIVTTDDTSPSVGSTSSAETLPNNRQDKVATILLVKDLLKRKETLLDALSSMNEQARALHATGTADGATFHTTGSDGTVFQRQYAWLVVNLDVTNRYLKAALLRLQDFATGSQAFGVSMIIPPVHSSNDATADANNVAFGASTTDSATDSSQSTLTLEQMRWAVNFLTQCRKKATELVQDTTTSTVTTSSVSATSNREDDRLLPETQELIANCVALFGVIRRGASPSIPPLITQKLLDRMFELLEPRSESNLDLFAELRAAAEDAIFIQRQRHS
ncbi:hypothetical protein PINS_up010446 [Pythium insidiosum]|nr:hypothetical protein PINS_up010446 [Pythium insidiosum]